MTDVRIEKILDAQHVNAAEGYRRSLDKFARVDGVEPTVVKVLRLKVGQCRRVLTSRSTCGDLDP